VPREMPTVGPIEVVHGERPRQSKRKREQGSDRRDGSLSDDSEAAAERAEHHYMLRKGDGFDQSRYTVTRQLGKGTFGRVVEMWDSVDKRAVAVKVVRAVEKYAREAEIEAKIILDLQKTLPAGRDFPIVRLFRTFEARGHYCLAFEKLGPSLFSALKSTRGLAQAQPSGAGRSERSVVRAGIGSYFTLPQIASIAADCFEALEHIHSIRLTHTDLKPENILLVAPLEKGSALPAHPRVALIDFGGATWQHEHHSSVVCTRQYRPPEVTLGLEWNHSVDQWSMGCILAELWTGALLFSTHDEVEHLALMERTLGALPRCMLRAATCMRAERNFRHGYLRWPERALDRDSEEHVRAQRRLRECLGADSRGEPLRWSAELSDFHELLWRLLEFQPEHRLCAAAALQQPFVQRARHKSGARSRLSEIERDRVRGEPLSSAERTATAEGMEPQPSRSEGGLRLHADCLPHQPSRSEGGGGGGSSGAADGAGAHDGVGGISRKYSSGTETGHGEGRAGGDGGAGGGGGAGDEESSRGYSPRRRSRE